MFDPTIGQFLGEDPLKFDAGDPNLRRYVGNNPTNATDPSGLEKRVVNGYKVKNIGGHHPVAVQLWKETGFKGEVFEIWDNKNARIFQPEGMGHGNRAHGNLIGYNRHTQELLRNELRAYIKENGKNGKLTLNQQKAFAREFLEKVRSQPKNTFIGGFNHAVRKNGRQGVRDWFKQKGSRFARLKASEPVSIRGTLKSAGGATRAVAGKTLGAGGKALGVLNAAGIVSDIREGVGALKGEETVMMTYHWEDKHGEYHYEMSGGTWYHTHTNKVYTTGALEGKSYPAIRIWAQMKVWVKSVFNRPVVNEWELPPELRRGGRI